MSTVMIIDDQLIGRIILEEVIKSMADDIQSHSFEDPVKALEWAKNNPVDLILADYKMPHLDGVELTQWIRKIPTCADVPIIIVTAYDQNELKYRALEAGASDFLIKPVDHHECRARCRNLLTIRQQQKIIRQKAFSLEKEIEGKTKELHLREKESLLQLAKISLYRERVDEDHLVYLSYGASLLAQTMGYGTAFCNAIEYAAPLHDIGKIGVPDAVLAQAPDFTPQARKQFEQHTQTGHDLLIHSSSNYLRLGAKIALNHHERYDGSGYPNGIQGDAIPPEAVIVGLLDTFADLVQGKSGQAPCTTQDAIKFIQAGKDRDFAADFVDAFTGCIGRILDAQQAFAPLNS